uniref:hypothetical protein n=1 Tax=Lentilactobacillus hilgardii TaxID=1588 RepID=UPI00403EFDC7
MRVVFWNCNGGFQNKIDCLLTLKADLYIVAEAEDPDKIKNQNYLSQVKEQRYLKFSRDRKGLLLFTFSNDLIQPLNWQNYRMRYFYPFTFRDFTFLGLWAKDNYIEDIYLYTSFHLKDLKKSILIGDFNSNVKWDNDHGYRTHSDFNNLMKQINHVSAYHSQERVPFGQEQQATFYMYRHYDRPYFIDYAYLPRDQAFHISYGDAKTYLVYSDHIPVILDLK